QPRPFSKIEMARRNQAGHYHPQILGEDYLRRIGVMVELQGFFVVPAMSPVSGTRPRRDGLLRRGWRALVGR
ncbi:hypothetical protein, partial [Burkholderia pseudomallei]|uniref:hypothetical protein n=1 Tax=Burkholderia pseudomallei TaxID=28450 RepID=UPI001C4DC57D